MARSKGKKTKVEDPKLKISHLDMLRLKQKARVTKGAKKWERSGAKIAAKYGRLGRRVTPVKKCEEKETEE